MFTKEWFESEDIRYVSCLEAVRGFYAVSTADIFKTTNTRIRQVFMKMLVLCCVSENVIIRLTDAERFEVGAWLNVARVPSSLRQSDRRVVQVLMRYLATGVDADPDLPQSGGDERYDHHDYEVKLNILHRVHGKFVEAFESTPAGRRWGKKFRTCGPYKAISSYGIVAQKPACDDLLDVWSENRLNDSLILRCMATIAEPVDWRYGSQLRKTEVRGEVVFLVQGYQLAFGLSDEEVTRFEADGRVVLVKGHSAYMKSRPTRCLLFLTSDQARRFVYTYEPEHRNREHRAFLP